MTPNRREFLQLNLGLAFASLFGVKASAELLSDKDQDMLADIMYRLFPHPDLDKAVYEQVTEELYTRISASGELTQMLDTALDSLGKPGEWAHKPDAEKQALLEEIQRTPFFQFVLNETMSGVYRHPLTWKLLGFEGSSLEFGGYIDRGFNDIDWLPR